MGEERLNGYSPIETLTWTSIINRFASKKRKIPFALYMYYSYLSFLLSVKNVPLLKEFY